MKISKTFWLYLHHAEEQVRLKDPVKTLNFKAFKVLKKSLKFKLFKFIRKVLKRKMRSSLRRLKLLSVMAREVKSETSMRVKSRK